AKLLEAKPQAVRHDRAIHARPKHPSKPPRGLGPRLAAGTVGEMPGEGLCLPRRQLSVEVGVQEKSSLGAVHLPERENPCLPRQIPAGTKPDCRRSSA